MAIEVYFEFFAGPLALLLNVIEHGFPSGTKALSEYVISMVGTAFWFAVALAAAGR